MRKMFPGPYGTPTTVNDGTPFTVSFSHNITTAATPAQMSYDFWTTSAPFVYEYIVFVQDSVSNDVLQCASASYTVGNVSTGLAALQNEKDIAVYPNPAQDFTTISLRLAAAAAVDLSIKDLEGRVVYTKQSRVDAGSSELRVNTSGFAPGTYIVLLNYGSMLFKEKLVVTR